MVPNTPQKSPERPHFGDFGGPKKQPNSKSADSRQTEFGSRNTQVGVGQRVPKNTPKPSSRALPAPIGPNIEKRTKKAPQKAPNGSPKSSQNRPRGPGRTPEAPKRSSFSRHRFRVGFWTPKVTTYGSVKRHTGRSKDRGVGTTAEAGPVSS